MSQPPVRPGPAAAAAQRAEGAAVSLAAGRLWRKTLKLTGLLLGIWLLLNLLTPWFARDLNAWQFAGFPLGWWLAAQGGLLAYLAIAWGYVWWMDRLEARYLEQQPEQDLPPPSSSQRPGSAAPHPGDPA